jgi:hypothetical protein
MKRLSSLLVAAFSCGVAALPAQAKSLADQLKMLAPDARAEQNCNAQVSDHIRREHKEFKPDEVVAYAFGDVKTRGTELSASGAAFRSRKKWYRVSYQCRVTPDGLGIETFTYTLGPNVPREAWSEHYLVP